jgi:hypothetical protein
MDSPYLESGESIILTTDRVRINSLQYDLLLTTKYLILIDIRYARFQPQKIPLMAILSVKAGEIATGDLAITLFFSDTSRTGGSDRMNLIFLRQPGEQRERERDEWLKKLMEHVVAGRQESIGHGIAPIDQDTGIRPARRRQIAPEMQRPHSTVIDLSPAQIELTVIHDEPEGTAPPEETVPEAGARAPSGEKSQETAPEAPASPDREIPDVTETFTPGVPADESDSIPETTGAEEISDESEELLSTPVVSEMIAPEVPRDGHADAVIPDATIPEETLSCAVPETTSPDMTPPDESETIIWGEPSEVLTRSEVPDSATPVETPAVLKVESPPPDRTEPEELKIITPIPAREDLTGSEVSVTTTTVETPVDTGDKPASPEPWGASFPAIGKVSPGPSETGIPEGEGQGESAGSTEAESTSPVPGSPAPPHVFGNRQKSFMIAAAILILILGVAGIAVFSPSYFSAPLRELSTVPAPSQPGTVVPVSSTLVTPAPTTVIIPPTGVWVRVTYPQDYYGRLGNPGSLREITGSGDRLYQMNADNRLVQVQMYKTDNSGDILSVEVYRNGELISHRTTSSPRGFIDLLIDVTTGGPPGIPPRVTQTTSPVQTTNKTLPVSNPGITLQG